MIVTQETFIDVLNFFTTQKIFVIDVETDGLYAYRGNSVCGIGIALMNGATYYFPFRHKGVDKDQNLSFSQFEDLIYVLNQATILIGYNIKFDLHMLIREGLNPWDKELIDVIVLVRLTEKEKFARLSLSETIDRSYELDYDIKPSQYDMDTKEALKKGKWIKDFSTSPISLLGPYCEEDVKWTLKLYFDRTKGLRNTGQVKIVKMQRQLTKVLLRMENRGIGIDNIYLNKAYAKINERMKVLTKRLYKHFGEEFNINSSAQIGKLYNARGIHSPEKTKAGKESWDEVALIQIDDPMVGYIREYRTLEKMKGTYLEPFRESNELHTNFLNWGTITGRLSSRDPALQTIPRFLMAIVDRNLNNAQQKEIQNRIEAMLRARKTEYGGTENLVGGSTMMSWGSTGDEKFDDANDDFVSIRRLFIAKPGYKLLAFDYSQMEIRVFLSYLNNPTLFDAMNKEGFDFHTEAAKIAFKVDETNSAWKMYRTMAKAITFGILYGIGIRKLAAQLDVDEEKAKEYREEYFKGIAGSRRFIRDAIKEAETRGFIRNRYGRYYAIPRERSYITVNYLVQGTSADIVTEKLIELDPYLQKNDCHLVLQIHDEILCEVPEKNYMKYAKEIKGILEVNSLGIPLKVDSSYCDPSWAQKVDIFK